VIDQLLLAGQIGLGLAAFVEVLKKDLENAGILAMLLALITFTVQ
jgi:hypothetical protein